MTHLRAAAIAALMLAVSPLAAAAEPGNGNGNGRGQILRGEDGSVACPPGLARRDPACIPPGQVRRLISDEEREQRRAARRAERRAAIAREAELVEEARAEVEESSDDQDRATAILTALLAPRVEAAPTPTGVSAAAPAPASAPAPAAATSVDVSEAMRRAATKGSIGY